MRGIGTLGLGSGGLQSSGVPQRGVSAQNHIIIIIISMLIINISVSPSLRRSEPASLATVCGRLGRGRGKEGSKIKKNGKVRGFEPAVSRVKFSVSSWPRSDCSARGFPRRLPGLAVGPTGCQRHSFHPPTEPRHRRLCHRLPSSV